jgi:hypothetical protein
LPVNGVPDRRFRMNAVTAIVFFWWRRFLLPLCTVRCSCNTCHCIPKYRLPLFAQIAIARFAICWNPDVRFGIMSRTPI